MAYNKKVIGLLSQDFHRKIQQYLNENYTVYNVIIDFVVHWHHSDTGEELKHPLCKIIMKK